VRGVAEFSANHPVTLGPMDSSTHLTKVALFPLCDVHGILINTLCDTSDLPGTHGDSLILAWRLALPEGMDVGEAAEALLVVAGSVPRKAWSESQLLIVRELRLLSGRKPSVTRVRETQLRSSKPPMHRARHWSSANRNAVDKDELTRKTQNGADRSADPSQTSASSSKENKKWWKLVGRDPSSSDSTQRKTRRQRVFRDI